MNINFHILKASGRLNSYAEIINKICNEVKEKVTAKIPINNVDVVIADNPYHVIPETGIGGYTKYKNYIEISIDPEFKNIDAVFSQNLKSTLTHEFHHAIRMQTIGYGEKLLEGIISEGLADHFNDELNENKSFHPWTKALTEDQIEKFLKIAIGENNKKYDHNAWFFGSKKEGSRLDN